MGTFILDQDKDYFGFITKRKCSGGVASSYKSHSNVNMKTTLCVVLFLNGYVMTILYLSVAGNPRGLSKPQEAV